MEVKDGMRYCVEDLMGIIIDVKLVLLLVENNVITFLVGNSFRVVLPSEYLI